MSQGKKIVLTLRLFHLCSCVLTLHADHTVSISAILSTRILPFTPRSVDRSWVNFKAAHRTLQLYVGMLFLRSVPITTLLHRRNQKISCRYANCTQYTKEFLYYAAMRGKNISQKTQEFHARNRNFYSKCVIKYFVELTRYAT